ncbi:MAG: gfo/Idh/MocA family oxidoreductase, partial [Acidobacteria bacterium]
IVGLWEPDRARAELLVARYSMGSIPVFPDLASMLEKTRPEAVAAFGSIAEHLQVVRACAPRGIHVMVEKPLAFRREDARTIKELSDRHRIHVLTNYETTWYPSVHAMRDLLAKGAIGAPRKFVVRDGHRGPREIGCSEEFLAWLTDPAGNGAGALVDFGCYGANLITWLMSGKPPLTVTAITQQIKPNIYPKVDDEATIIVTYPHAQGIIQASWNWPIGRKDLDVYGQHGYLSAPDGSRLRMRKNEAAVEESVTPVALPASYDDPFAYFAAVVRGTIEVKDDDPSSLANTLVVVQVLDAAIKSAREGRTIQLTGSR